MVQGIHPDPGVIHLAKILEKPLRGECMSGNQRLGTEGGGGGGNRQICKNRKKCGNKPPPQKKGARAFTHGLYRGVPGGLG